MVAPLHTVLVRRPDSAFGNADPNRWHYTAQPHLAKAQQEHDAFVALLNEAGCEVVYHDVPLLDHADAIFTHDPSLVCDKGAIILSMGKPLRTQEPNAQRAMFEKLGVPIHYTLHGSARAEGGDCVWVDEKTLAVGLGFRTNAEGMRQIQEALPHVEVVPVHLPYYLGELACLHLMSFISMLDDDLAVVYLPHMPVPFFQLLQARGVKMIDIPEHEYATMGTNVLATAPRQCIMLRDNPITIARLKAEGCAVRTYAGDEISLKAEGGATCLTRPILRY